MQLRSYLALLGSFVTAFLVLAQAPVATEANIKYPLSAREGPWMIHIGSFRGDEALDFAHRFAEEARTKHRLLTYIYSMNEEDAVKERERIRQEQLKLIGSEKVAQSNEPQKLKTVRVVKEYSVFVGNFADMEKARYEAARIKEFPPPASIPEYGIHLYNESTTRAKADPVQGDLASIFKLKSPTGSEEGKRLNQSRGNPYRQAFVVRNPLASRAQSNAVTQVNQSAPIPMDPSWKELNEKEKHSIFTNPKKWTLVVAMFSPPSEVQSSITGSVVQTGFRSSANDLGKGLERAAETARQLAELLRDGGKGYDAYVFHTRQYSLVTVGAFESRFDPNMEQAWSILNNFAESQAKTKGPFALLQKPPQPMQIPGR